MRDTPEILTPEAYQRVIANLNVQLDQRSAEIRRLQEQLRRSPEPASQKKLCTLPAAIGAFIGWAETKLSRKSQK